MTFSEVLEQIREKVRAKGRVTYGALKREFGLDDDYVADITAELIDAERVARDEDGKVLVWVGQESKTQRIGVAPLSPQHPALNTQTPISYTPAHLAEHRMLAASYNWFTEGFDTADLQEAKALLEVLAEG